MKAMTTKKIICKTTFVKNVLPPTEATNLFIFLRDNIQWGDGIPSKKGFTRKAAALDMGDVKEIDLAILKALPKLTTIKYSIQGIYLNYYETGEMWTPNHNHPGTHQLVISLGQTRVLEVAKKPIKMENGDAIIFGSAIHGVPKDDSVDGRISIATFMVPMTTLERPIFEFKYYSLPNNTRQPTDKEVRSDEDLAIRLQALEWSGQ